MAGKNLTVYLTSDVSKFRRGIRTAEGELKGFRGKVARFGPALRTGVTAGLLGVSAAAGTAAVKFGTDGVQAFIDDEKAGKKLAQTLKNLGKEQDTSKVEAYIDQLSHATGVADDDLRPAFEKLIGATGDTDSAMRLLSAAVDTSVGSGKDLAGTADAIAKAVGPKGTLGALKRLFPGLDTTKTKAGDAESVMGELNKRFGGQAAARMDTYAGKLQSVNTEWGEFQESFGGGFLGELDGANDGIGTLSDTLYNNRDTAAEWGRITGEIATNLVTIASVAGKAGGALTGAQDWLTEHLGMPQGGTPLSGLAGQISSIIEGGRYIAGRVTGNQAAAQAALNDYKGIKPKYAASIDIPEHFFDPVTYMAQMRHNAARADARVAQRAVRTNVRP